LGDVIIAIQQKCSESMALVLNEVFNLQNMFIYIYFMIVLFWVMRQTADNALQLGQVFNVEHILQIQTLTADFGGEYKRKDELIKRVFDLYSEIEDVKTEAATRNMTVSDHLSDLCNDWPDDCNKSLVNADLGKRSI
jgi:hypothetical protein